MATLKILPLTLEAEILSFIDNNPSIASHRFSMEKLFRMNEHVLDSKAEQLLSYFNAYSGSCSDLYDNLATADKKVDYVKLSTGEKVAVTQGNWRSLVMDAKTETDKSIAAKKERIRFILIPPFS